MQKALRKISGDLGSISSFRQLKDIFLVDIVTSIQVYGGAIVLKYNDSLEIISEGTIEEDVVRRLIEANEYELENEMYSIFKINHHEEFTSYLIMTQKKTNTRLGLEEIQWLNLIVTYLSVGLENIHLVRKLTQQLQQWAAQLPDEHSAQDFVWFRKLMFELQEKERVRIATDLHDTTMQDLFFLKDRLLTLIDKYTFREEDKAHIRSLTDYIDVINSNLRQSCFELHPYLLKEIGLIPTIEKLVRFERAVSPFKLDFFTTQVAQIEDTDLETKRHLFRIVQELINNAKKHSQASHIRMVMRTTKGELHLDYEDDGVGFDERQISLPEVGSSGIGIAQMKSRVLFLNGRFEMTSGKGNGYKFQAIFPLKEGRSA
ncbi:sensor histidine kinase [Paenibacillus sp. HJGM_3]|uniref:sensor histidine kinase n=1 Tax=Paenibacillus sp. HJGM_3 TaxID=3379816 RepID=UPI00385EB5D4